MIVSNIAVNSGTPENITIGRRGTYNTQEVTFDLSYLLDNYGDGTAVLMVKRSQDDTAYPAVTTQEEAKLTWVVSDADTAYKGNGECELFWYVDGGLAKSVIYPLTVMRDIGETTEEPPDAYQTWVDHLTELGEETLENAQNAAQSATNAKESETNAANSATEAKEAAEMLTDVSATAKTLEPGSEATAKYNNGVFEFGIPKGEKGDKLTYADLTEADKEDLVQGPIKEAQDDAVEAVESAESTALQSINTAGSTAVGAVSRAGETQTARVNTAGQTQTNAVNQAGTTQVNAVNTAGETQVQAVEDKGTEVLDSIPDDYTELSNKVNDPVTGLDTKAPVILNTASGDIASLADGADSMPIKSLIANIEPVQDLHGYANPWPAGGGKNKLPITITTSTTSGVTFTVNDDGSISLSGTATETFNKVINDTTKLTSGELYKISGCAAGSTGTNYFIRSTRGVIAGCTTPEFGASATATDDALYLFIHIESGVNTNGLVFKPMICLASENDFTFSPYSNICPISGRTGMEVNATGGNIFDYTVCENKTVNNEGDISGATTRELSPVFSVKANHPHTITYPATVQFIGHIEYTDDNVFIRRVLVDQRTGETTFTPATNRIRLYFSLVNGGDMTVDDVKTVCLTPGSVGIAYEPYVNRTIPVSWETEAGTVYGGTLDLIKGEMRRTLTDNPELRWVMGRTTTDGQGRIFYSYFTDAESNISNIAYFNGALKKTSRPNVWENQEINTFSLASTNIVVASDNPDMTLGEFISWLNTIGTQFIGKLKTPIEYQLTPQQIDTLLGSNNIWADTGDVSVEYPADTKLYIQQLTQPEEDDMTANANIEANKFFMIGNALYYSTAAIAAGATIIPGTNCNAVSLADALNTLNA